MVLHLLIPLQNIKQGLKHSDRYQHKINFVLTFIKSDLTLVEIYAITLNVGSDMYQIRMGIVQVNTLTAQKISDV